MDKLAQCDKCNHSASEKAESQSPAEYAETAETDTTDDTNFATMQRNVTNSLRPHTSSYYGTAPLSCKERKN